MKLVYICRALFKNGGLMERPLTENAGRGGVLSERPLTGKTGDFGVKNNKETYIFLKRRSNMKLVYICRASFKNGGLKERPLTENAGRGGGAFRAAPHRKNRGFGR